MTRRLLLALALAGCAASAPAPTPLTALALPPAGFGRSVVLDQMVRGTFGGDTRALRFRVEVTPEVVTLVGLSAVGAPLFSLESRGGPVKAALPPGVDLGFDPGLMLADFQLAHWPAATLRPALAARALRLEEADGRRRVLDAAGRLVAEVVGFAPERLEGERVLIHHDRPYQLEIRTLAVEAAS